MTTALPKKQTVVLLRWVLIIAFSYLLLVDSSTGHTQVRLVILIAAALASNLVVARLPDRWINRSVADFCIVLFDAAWVTLGLVWAPNVSEDLFLLYFLVIFVAAMGESIPMIVGSALLVSLVYGFSVSWHVGEGSRLSTTALLRVPFLFVVGLFYGYFVTEIRGRKGEATEAQLRDQAKSELLAAVSHDLRGPLGNAESLLGLVLDGDPADMSANRMLLVRAQVNMRRVNSLVNNLLQAACIKAGQIHLQLTPVQLNDVVDDVYGLESGAAMLKDITLTRDADPQLPLITADLMQVGRVLTNLVDNAIKYTGQGGRVVIRTALDDDQVCVSVQDSGPGMTGEQCQALFAKYRRVHLGGQAPGTGLGLYIVKQLTEALGGTVRVDSELGAGSTFVVSLPRANRKPVAASAMGRMVSLHAPPRAIAA